MVKPKSTPKVTIIFPTYNGWKDTKECLTSLQKLDYSKKRLSIIVVDNNSSDHTPQKIKKYFPMVKVICQKKNLGYSKATNIAIKQSRGDYILFSNNDIVLSKNYLSNMVKCAQSDPKIGIIGSMVYLKEPKGKIGFNGLKVNSYLGYHQYDLTNLDKIRDCDLPPAGGFFVRRSMLNKIGVFDEGFFLYFEDLDLCLRAKQWGYRVVFNPHAIAYHGHARTTFRENFYKIVFQGYKSKWRCIIKNASIFQITTSLITELIILIATNIKAKPKTFRPIIDAILWNFKNINTTINSRKQAKLRVKP